MDSQRGMVDMGKMRSVILTPIQGKGRMKGEFEVVELAKGKFPTRYKVLNIQSGINIEADRFMWRFHLFSRATVTAYARLLTKNIYIGRVSENKPARLNR